MAKLLKHQLKENIRDIIPWMVIPLILSVVLNYINLYFDSAFLDFITVISMVVMYSSFAISMIIVILNDYKKFYGEEAAFYDVLPVKSEDITTSRVLNIMIIALLAGFIFFIEFFGFLLVTIGARGEDISQIFEQIKVLLGQVPSKTIIVFIITILISLLATLTRILASISIGSSKTFKDMGKFGPVLVFIIITIIVSIFGLTFGLKFFETFGVRVSESSIQTQSGFYLSDIKTVEEFTRMLGIGAILDLVASSIQIYLTNFFHKNKLTVA
ncbi:hypothetical protein HMPREF2852_02165 [Anaerococcus sp. HMSC065G05]|uniref:hypothetical protein n=1 Tax=Anaerococcus sp. HMSC065G05 TaxID=1739356 RepID=UPI0008A15EC9|nr:hypothetical protein [Anaerococcus sp. HMSC065G05]OFJ67599.1 hypothetical protein HMPREF2852_02165 [Anaerococcus sp. HMSC065G05]